MVFLPVYVMGGVLPRPAAIYYRAIFNCKKRIRRVTEIYEEIDHLYREHMV